MSTGAGTAPLVALRNIHKAFGGVRAVEDASVNLHPGEVVALLGHNGAGKSTLMKMLAGAYPIDSGEVLIRGEKAHIRTPADAQALGIETIYQTLALADNLDSVANLFLGRELLTPVAHAGRPAHGRRRAQGVRAAEQELQELPRAGAPPVGRATADSGDLARPVLQRAHPHHGRALCRAGA
jgi:ABC-type sugar transport system ATPase subunit